MPPSRPRPHRGGLRGSLSSRAPIVHGRSPASARRAIIPRPPSSQGNTPDAHSQPTSGHSPTEVSSPQRDNNSSSPPQHHPSSTLIFRISCVPVGIPSVVPIPPIAPTHSDPTGATLNNSSLRVWAWCAAYDMELKCCYKARSNQVLSYIKSNKPPNTRHLPV